MTAPAINVNDLTFGIEIETAMPRGVVHVGGCHCGVQIPQLPEGWRAERDGSIRCPAEHEACEIVSPVLKGEDGIRQVLQVLAWLNSVGAKVNRSTGFHVHVGWNGDAETTKRLVFLVSNFEKALFAATGTRSREQGHYCQPIQSDSRFQIVYRDGCRGCVTERYHVLNVTNLGGSSYKRTVEFRVFSGTLNPIKAIGYIRLCLGLAEKALSMKKVTGWAAKATKESSPIHRSGEGQTALTRLFYGLGWTKGRESHTFGNVTTEEAPALEAIKKELMRLARKYDKGTEETNE
jgi:hypothetical protein